jgi:hypothetical protein
MAFVFTPEETSTPDGLKRRRRYAEALMAQGTDASPVKHWTQALARVLQSGMGGYLAGKADREEKENAAADSGLRAKMLAEVLGGSAATSSPASSPTPAAPSMAGDGAARSMSMPSVTPEMKEGIVKTASALGISPVDLATTISYETAGTFDPTKAGPRTQWGQHRGLIQFGEPQAKQHGVDWTNPVASQLGENGAVASYLRTAGVKPGMGLLDIYSAINAGAPGLYNRSDAGNGGAPGTVRDKVEKQMAGHRAKAQALFADLPAAGAGPVAAETGAPGFVVPPGEPAMDQRQFNAIHGNEIVQPVFQSEGVGQPWMGTALQPAGPQVASAPLPPPRPADLAMPQADVPAQGAVPAIGQMAPAPPPEDLSNAPGAGARELLVQALQGGQGPAQAPTPAPQPATPPAATPALAQGAPAAAAAANIPNSALIEALTNPRASAATQQLAASLLSQRVKPRDQWLEQKLPDGSLAQRNSQTGEVKVIRPGELLSPEQEAQKIRVAQAGRTQINNNVGGGSDKQVFDAADKSAETARAAATGLNSLREARRAVEGGAILGAGADLKLGLQKAAAAFGIGDTSKIVNTETFRSAIAPQISAMMKATVGSTQISNADREFAEKAAGGSITLDEGSIRRLLDIMERGNIAILEGHQKRLETIYPDEATHRRERALFSVPFERVAPAPAAPSSPAQRPTGQTKSGVKWSVE